ncbi:flagellar type III secretion system pore protein FliP [Rhizobium sp. TH2]|uniref:flagellar type III secretion system pore protein FliP n=1 Tax=Rhizobium sp. TH2 TaxID=2775403 RepID=UPI0021574FDE|nr:flagellar type III secretion system pore protein FliP [Rhizobium sp. TH2]UVC09944.1 flagellar type III secretion system pore protein FliP [Rhizobium sp. TH2]
MTRHALRKIAIAFVVILLSSLAGGALAQTTTPDILNTPVNGSVANWIIRTFGLLTILSVAPGILVMVTSFPRFIIAFSILRSGMGLASTPSNMILTSLALFMTFFVMAPTLDRAWRDGAQPLLAEQITEAEALQRVSVPFREFMAANTRDKDLKLFADIATERGQQTTTGGQVDLRVLVPAFMISEIRRGFEIGFLIVLPFLVIDLVVATITMAMGMMMLPPTSISLPFKILFFVLIDGWNLLVGSLVRSFS